MDDRRPTPRVLFVDDQSAVCNLLSGELSEGGQDDGTASGGQEGFEMMQVEGSLRIWRCREFPAGSTVEDGQYRRRR
jgi:CheY-like chemotaxis protein